MRLHLILLSMGCLLSSIGPAADAGQTADPHTSRWSQEKANQWYAEQPWLVGFNFVPSTACNAIEMWQATTFDPKTIDRELGLAEETGFNSCRVFINYVVWEDDPDGLLDRFDEFLGIAARHGISVMPVLFDDCGFSPEGAEPNAGKQAAPVPGVHNSCWFPSPGPARVRDRSKYGLLEGYVKGLIGRFAKDARVVIWDTPDIWLRRTFVVNAPEIEGASLFVHHDEGCEVYLNGVLALKTSGYLASYRRCEILPQARTAFRHGANTIAVHCRQTTGGQFIDVGIVAGGPEVER